MEREQGSRPVYSVTAKETVLVPMRDGVRLAVDVYRPDAEGKLPARWPSTCTSATARRRCTKFTMTRNSRHTCFYP